MKMIKKSIYTFAISALLMSCNNSETTENHDAHGHNNATTEHHDHTDGEHQHENEEGTTQAQIAEDVDAEKFKSLIDEGSGLLLDVRTAGEVANGTIESSTNIDFNSPKFKQEIENLDKNQPVLVFCASGGRSGSAMRMMKDMGFKEVYNLKGGYMGWPYK